MPKTLIELTYRWNGAVRSAIVILPIRHAENAYAWMKAHYPCVEVLDTRTRCEGGRRSM